MWLSYILSRPEEIFKSLDQPQVAFGLPTLIPEIPQWAVVGLYSVCNVKRHFLKSSHTCV